MSVANLDIWRSRIDSWTSSLRDFTNCLFCSHSCFGTRPMNISYCCVRNEMLFCLTTLVHIRTFTGWVGQGWRLLFGVASICAKQWVALTSEQTSSALRKYFFKSQLSFIVCTLVRCCMHVENSRGARSPMLVRTCSCVFVSFVCACAFARVSWFGSCALCYENAHL
jgi:hypothetical protein